MKRIGICLALVICLCLTTCKQDGCSDRIMQKLDSHAIASIPYQNGQIIKFKTPDSLIIAAAVSRLSEVMIPDAPYVCEDYLEIRLKSSNANELYIEILLRGSAKSNLIHMRIYHKSISGPSIQFLVDTNQTLAIYSNDGQSSYYEHLEIDGVNYSNVLQITYSFMQDEKWIKNFYYNAEYGILKIETNDNFTLSLKK